MTQVEILYANLRTVQILNSIKPNVNVVMLAALVKGGYGSTSQKAAGNFDKIRLFAGSLKTIDTEALD